MREEDEILLPLREKVSPQATDERSKDASFTPAKKATRRARALRRTQPATERILWKLLRDRRLAEFKFRRQVPLGPYVVDFACFARRLIVEADGPFHDPQADAVRDAWLASQGFRVLRFTNAEVANRGRVLGRILDAALELSPQRPFDPSSVSLRLTPSPARGEGK